MGQIATQRDLNEPHDEKVSLDDLDIQVNPPAQPTEESAVSHPPDGGIRAWMTVVAVFFTSFIAFGTSNVWGIFQDAYVNDPSSRFLQDGDFKLGFVGGCSAGFAFAIGPFSNVLISKFGIHLPVLLGVLLMVVALELASISTQFWQLLLSQGILFGIGASLAYIPAIGLPSQWFQKKRALATGIASSGSGIGAVILSPVVQTAINRMSIPWAIRILGFICLVLGLGAASIMRRRVHSTQVVQYKIFDVTIFKVPGYPLYLAFAFIQFFGYITPLFFIPSYCIAIGISSTDASAVLSVVSAINAIGRITAGQLADQYGTINILMIFNFLAGLMCIIIWLFAKNLGIMMVFGVFWGFFSGAYWALSVPTSAKVVGMDRLGSAVAIQFLMNVVPPIFAVPIGSQIVDHTALVNHVSVNSREAYRYLIIFCGVMAMVASLFLLPIRLRFSRRLLEKV